ncbi:MAG: glycosyltransferase family 4 protein [bacterium]|nr:glycosyltransferase family 4 protein [bacterium]
MKIGIDVSFLARDSRGMGRVARALITQLLEFSGEHYYFLMPLHEKDREGVVKLLKPFADRFEFIPVSDADRLDLVWFPWNRVDFFPKCKRVVTIHDVAMFRFFSSNKRDNFNDRKRIREAAAAADMIVAISEFSKSEISSFLDVAQDRITVIHHGYDSCFGPASPERASEFLQRHTGGKPYVFFVGSPDKRKSMDTLLMAFDRLKSRSDIPHKLLMAGSRPSFLREPSFTERFASEILRQGSDPMRIIWGRIKHKDDIIWQGSVGDKELVRFYGLSSAFVFPSLYEGFGLPVLEAFSCACPIVASDIPVFREVGGDAPVFFSPGNPSDLAEKLGKVLADNNLASSMRARGLKRVKNFSWKKAAESYFRLFRTME